MPAIVTSKEAFHVGHGERYISHIAGVWHDLTIAQHCVRNPHTFCHMMLEAAGHPAAAAAG
jgi:hypothetical protein